ncbi:MAG: adenosylmethionine--8-amino-7-oxononanoate transaminase [Geothrix sp.]|uniref:adenosylmethionine--8-amino-7-oxononanoate transaminase n=1 Tax=Geothrix sp. TaxID=1962974 RepID=UPI0017CF8C95|nr:adenosylmethionine--8-amino-7-oxononanoate transaminase [Geothrix sp.]NWJ40723.1 adenosylmethionine--8-amino-7-oxononanoate transaminase [Geothrix sp.]WIL21270.1 MAG: adenosylmethionine--8-amino-7-oxononanoate transaminase [Geothrix sp.]
MPTPLPPDWSDRLILDRAHVWHPFTQMKVHEADPPIPVVGGEGCDLLLANGERVLDGISSWWTCLHGHGHPRLVSALERQAAKLDHAMFAGFTHKPALELVARLRPKLPANLTRAFFSDDGSTAVEVALKMAFQAQLQRGEQGRARFGALRGGYHGDTLGAVGVGELENFMTGLFSPLLLACDRLEVPEDPRRDIHPDLAGWPARLDAAREEIQAFFHLHGGRLAAFIAEPLIQCAGGMRMWPPELLQELRAQCDAHGVYLILDEVATGFGRTGTFLACEQATVAPDLLCLSKGLTGGTLPLSMTWATEALYGQFWGEPASGRAFLHGHSYTANPTACAVACASLALFDDEPVMASAATLHTAMTDAFTTLSTHPAVRQARVLGTIGACRLVDPATGKPHDPEARFGWRLHRQALDHGLLVRPIGDCLYLMPPLNTPPARIREAAETLADLLSR